jgi:hypothetical protein
MTTYFSGFMCSALLAVEVHLAIFAFKVVTVAIICPYISISSLLFFSLYVCSLVSETQPKTAVQHFV